MKIDVELYEQIRTLYLVDGLSQREIATKLSISRNTVAKYCNGSFVPWERKTYKERSNLVVTQEVTEFILKCLAEDQKHNIKKQKHTSVRIFERLQDELNFQGSESNIRKVVKKIKDVKMDAFIPLAFDPGEAAQIDFGTAYAYINSKRVKFKYFCMRLCFSGHIFVKAYYAENEECFLDGHVSAFEYFGGTPRRIIFDNAKVAVKEGLGAYVKKEAKRYQELKAHYAFSTNYCNPRSGNEKGLVENLVGLIRRKVFVPMPQVESLDELNQILLKACDRYLSHQIKSRSGTVLENFLLEKVNLLSLPIYPYHSDLVFYTEASSYSLVTFQTNKYSVPTDYAGKEVLVKVSASMVTIQYKNKVIAMHERSYQKQDKKYNIEHYIELLEKRPRSVLNAEPVRQFVPREIIEEYSRHPNGNLLLLELIKNQCVTKSIDKISVTPTSLNHYDKLIKEVKADEYC